MSFKVYDENGNDVTNERRWLIDSEGNLYYLTDNGSNSPLCRVDDYWYGD